MFKLHSNLFLINVCTHVYIWFGPKFFFSLYDDATNNILCLKSTQTSTILIIDGIFHTWPLCFWRFKSLRKLKIKKKTRIYTYLYTKYTFNRNGAILKTLYMHGPSYSASINIILYRTVLVQFIIIHYSFKHIAESYIITQTIYIVTSNIRISTPRPFRSNALHK